MCLSEILYLLDENIIREKIDAPIDEILNKYSYSVSEDISQKELISIIAGFLKQLKNQGIFISIESDEFSEVFSFLQKHYSGENSKGYERALYDATNFGKEGINTILEDTSESLKMELRKQYIDWIFNTKVTYLDWASKLKLVKELSDQYSFSFSTEISSMPDGQKALFLKEIFSQNLNTVRSIKSILQTKLFNF